MQGLHFEADLQIDSQHLDMQALQSEIKPNLATFNEQILKICISSKWFWTFTAADYQVFSSIRIVFGYSPRQILRT